MIGNPWAIPASMDDSIQQGVKCGCTGAALPGNARPNWGNDAVGLAKKKKKRKIDKGRGKNEKEKKEKERGKRGGKKESR